MAGSYTAAELKLAEDIQAQLRGGNYTLAAQTLSHVSGQNVSATDAKKLVEACKDGYSPTLINLGAGREVVANSAEVQKIAQLDTCSKDDFLSYIKSKDTNTRLTAFAAQKYPNAGAAAAPVRTAAQPAEPAAAPVDTSNLEATEDQIVNCAIHLAKGFQKMLKDGNTEDIARYLTTISGLKVEPEKLDSMLDDAEAGMALDAFNQKHGTDLDAAGLQVFAKARVGEPGDYLNLIKVFNAEDKYLERMKRYVEKKMRETNDPNVFKSPEGAAPEAGASADGGAPDASQTPASASEGASSEGGKTEVSFLDDPQKWLGQQVSKITNFMNIGEKIVGFLKNSANSTLQGIGNFFGGFMNSIKSFMGNILGGLFGGGDQPDTAGADPSAPPSSAGPEFNAAANQPASNTPQVASAPSASTGAPAINGDFAAASADTSIPAPSPAAAPQAAPVAAPAPAMAGPGQRNG